MARRRLVVIAPGIRGGTSRWHPLLTRLRAEPSLSEDTEWLTWDHHRSYLSRVRAHRIAVSLAAEIHAAWVKAGGFEEIILVGHSFGGLLVKQAFVIGKGFDEEIPGQSPWSDAVTRIILLAGINRGVGAGRRDEPGRKWSHLFAFIAWLFSVIPWLRTLLSYDLMRGAGFITNQRIQWIRCFAQLADPPLVVQLLGDDDAVVTREDSLDIDQLGSGWQVTVPATSHSAIIDVAAAAAGETRYALIRSAFLDHGTTAALKWDNAPPIAGADEIVFIMHGIRSNNSSWVQDLGTLIREQRPSMTVIQPTYGFFTALKFALPSSRRRIARWFQDQYAQAFVLNAHAKFYFVGHSNGTYVFGESLRKIGAIKFQRAVLVASVLPAQYDWESVCRRNQVGTFCNVRSNRDVPVSLLCSALRGLGMRDVGTGGFHGFDYALPRKQEVFWYQGGHGAALEDARLPHLVDFLLADPASHVGIPDGWLTHQQPPWFIDVLSRLAPWLARGLVAAAIGLCFWLYTIAPQNLSIVAGGLLGVLVLRDVV